MGMGKARRATARKGNDKGDWKVIGGERRSYEAARIYFAVGVWGGRSVAGNERIAASHDEVAGLAGAAAIATEVYRHGDGGARQDTHQDEPAGDGDGDGGL